MMSSIKSSETRAFTLVRVLIVFFGLATVTSAVLFFPLGALLSLVAAVAAIIARGTNRKLLLVVAAIGLLTSLVMALSLVAVGGHLSVGTVMRM